MTKQILIQVEMGDSREINDPEKLTSDIRQHAAIAIINHTEGPVPSVKVFECLDAQDEDLACFRKDLTRPA